MHLKTNIIFILVGLFTFASCNKNEESNTINTVTGSFDSLGHFQHFNHLYKEIDFKGKKVGIVHIYSQYPDYEYAIEPKEGFTCVDDVSRAIVLLSKYLSENDKDEIAQLKMERLTEFVLQMQHSNGYFNNFIWNDLSINTTYATSVAELNWWSFRALWGLESAYPFLKSDTALAKRITDASQRLLENIKRDLPINKLTSVLVEGMEMPTWLPQQYAADQSALLMLGLLKNHERTADPEIERLVDALAQGIMMLQKGDSTDFPHGVFLSWQNLWHAWGNSQAYALLKAGQYFDKPLYIDSALKEIDNFYPWLLNNGFVEAIWIKKKAADGYVETQRNSYPQIAYGLRPMIWAAREAYRYSQEEKYQTLAQNLQAWLSGENDASSAIFNPQTGLCFDGIISPTEINRNSGAESTIESLLIFLEMK